MTDTPIDATTRANIPVYEIAAQRQGDGQWLLTAVLPGGAVTHTVPTLEDPYAVAKELKSVIALHLGFTEVYFRELITAKA